MAHFSLRTRIAAAMVATALVTGMLFSLAALFLAFTVEDHRYTSALEHEIARQKSHWAAHGAFAKPAQDYIRLYRTPNELPTDLATRWDADEQHAEHAADNGRHYYVSQFAVAAGTNAIAVADVGHLLVVAPNLGGVLKFLALIGVFAAMAAAGVGYALARQALKPLARLAADATPSEDAVPSIDAARYPAGEVGHLAGALAASFRRIAAFVAREKAFTRDASHELRTPLAVIRSGAELAKTQPTDRQEQALARIESAVQEMDATLDLLLAIAREESGVTAKTPTPLLPLVERAVLNASGRFPASGVKVSVDVAENDLADINSPAAQLVLNNIVANAFQHAGGSELTIAGGSGTLVIADTGPGLAGQGFSPFSKGGASEGTGLGLSIVRRLCDSAGIGLTIESSPASGTCFRLDFGTKR